MYKNRFGINNLQLLMHHKTKPNQTKLSYWVDFARSADDREKRKESKKIDIYLDLTEELKK